jgi:ligand-binding SRPBCC domain-containing protein
MGVYTVQKTQNIPASLDAVWDFVSSPANLKEITPDYMGFEVTSKQITDKMYKGMIITYKVSPLLGIKMTWVTEISQVEDKKYFVDEQKVGPYKLWYHQHHLKEIDGGVEMIDIIHYQPPMGILGDIANTVFIARQLEGIFDYRRVALEKRFGIYKK